MVFVKFLAVAIAFSALTTIAQAIECYQCDSNIDLDCSELFDHYNYNLKPQPCDQVYGARFCTKTTGVFAGRIGTIRNCSARDLGDRCDYVKRPGDKRHIRSCVFTCSRDGCNLSSRINSNLLLMIITTILAIRSI